MVYYYARCLLKYSRHLLETNRQTWLARSGFNLDALSRSLSRLDVNVLWLLAVGQYISLTLTEREGKINHSHGNYTQDIIIGGQKAG